METRKWAMSAVLSFLILLIGMIGYWVLAKQKEPLNSLEEDGNTLRKVQVRQFVPKTSAHQISIDGRLTAFEKVNFSANVAGILLPSSKVLKEGTYVRKGELLFDIDQRKALFNLHAQRSQLLNLLTLMMPDLKLDYPDAYQKWMNYLDQFEVEKTIQDFPSIEDEQEKYFIASRNIQQLYYTIKSLEATLSDFKIYAPFSGTITQANIFPGTMVNPGQLLGAMINTASFELQAPVSEADLPYVKKGSRVVVKAGEQGKEWYGMVQRISNQIDPSTQNIPIFIALKGAGLKEGMYLEGFVEATPLQAVVSLSANMITDQEYIYVVKDSTIERFQLVIKKRNAEYLYVTNLEPDTWVVYSPPAGLFAGQKVIAEKTKTSD